MKHQITNLFFIPIFVLFVSLNVLGQKSDLVSPTIDTISEPDVNQFFAAFVTLLDETGDIDRMPKRFFISDFETRFAENDDWISPVSDNDAKLFEKLSSSERYKYNISVANFYYLILESYFNKKGSLAGYDDDTNIIQGLPRNAMQLLKQSKWFKSTFDNQVELEKPTTIAELKRCVAELEVISESIRKFLSNRSAKQKRRYIDKWMKRRKLQILDESNTSSDICEGNNCMGLPEKTRIHALHAFALCLRIAFVNGEFKVVDIYFGLNED
jgi:hypothetical protein